jgi:hypothetical protein
MKKHLLGAAALLASAMLATSAGAVVVYSDDFNDNDDSDWVFSTNFSGAAGLDPPTNNYLGPFIEPPPAGVDLIARGTKTLTLLAGDYTLHVDALSVPCGGCTISYDVLFDGALLQRAASFGSVHNLTFILGARPAGSHTITLGMHTTNASSGHFLATFDNVVLEGANLVQPTPGVPEPATWAMMLTGFFGAGAFIRRRKAVAA